MAIAVLIAVTLLPALLGFAGQRAGRGRRQKEGGPAERGGGCGSSSWTRRPWVAMGAVIAVIRSWWRCLGELHIYAQGLPDDGTQPTDTTERKSYDHLTEGFGPGFAEEPTTS